MRKIILTLISIFVISCAHEDLQDGISLEEAATGDHRSEQNIARNEYRHPVETLEFFELEPDMTVVEVSPGGGWYTEILGPYLKEEGRLYLAVFSKDSDRSYAARLNKKIKDMVKDQDLYGDVNFTVMESPDHIGPIAPEGSADRVFTFRNVHNWMKDAKAKEAFTAFYKALKPGGILGIVEHRKKSKKKQDPKARDGYVKEEFVKNLAKSVGFEFVAATEINANEADTTNWAQGVWTLPPTLRLGEKNKAKYLAVGESDRMTLKFKKPAAETTKKK